MILKSKILSLVAIACLFTTASIQAQVAGDGIPDLYWSSFDISWGTSAGTVSRPAGTLLLDTDGADVVAVLIGGVSAAELDAIPDNGDFLIGSTAFLPDPNVPPFFKSDWTVGQIANSIQWIRTSPLSGLGFEGVMGEYDDPSGIFPNLGLGCFVSNTFERVFENDGQMFQAVIATETGGSFYTDVAFPLAGSGTPTCGVPEPATVSTLWIAGLLVLPLRSIWKR